MSYIFLRTVEFKTFLLCDLWPPSPHDTAAQQAPSYVANFQTLQFFLLTPLSTEIGTKHVQKLDG